jgi:hypothetical protein
MQNHILNHSTELYISRIKALGPRIPEHIEQARNVGEYTQDIPVEHKDTEDEDTEDEDQYGLQLIDAVKSKPGDHVFKKYYFGFSQKVLLSIQNDV